MLVKKSATRGPLLVKINMQSVQPFSGPLDEPLQTVRTISEAGTAPHLEDLEALTSKNSR